MQFERKRLVKSTIIERFVDEVNIVGVDRIDPHTNSLRRIIWLCLVVFSTAFLLYHISERYAYFAANPVNVNIIVDYPSELLFPAVTVCNINMNRKLNQNADHEHKMPEDDTHSEDEVNLLEKTSEARVPEKQTKRDAIHGQSDKNILQVVEAAKLDTIHSHGYNWTDHFLFHSHKLESMLLKCLWNRKPCTHKNFTPVVTNYGLCYQFNGGTTYLHSVVSGPANGLNLVLDAEVDHYDFDDPDVDEVGFKISIHSHDVFPIIQAQAFTVNPGIKSSVQMQREDREYLEAPVGNCSRRALKYFDRYTRWGCAHECIGQHTVERCGCIFPSMVGESAYCSPIEMKHCKGKIQIEKAIVACRCPIQCKETTFHKTVTYTNIYGPGIKRIKLWKNDANTSEEYWKANVAQVNVFYEQIRNTTIQQQPAFGWYAFLSSLGGALGLLLGCCILTIFQFIDFLSLELINRFLLTHCIKRMPTDRPVDKDEKPWSRKKFYLRGVIN